VSAPPPERHFARTSARLSLSPETGGGRRRTPAFPFTSFARGMRDRSDARNRVGRLGLMIRDGVFCPRVVRY